MSDRLWRAAHRALLLAALGGLAAPLRAQAPDELRARREALRARVDSLTQHVKTLEAAERDAGLDTVARAGTLAVRTSAALQATASAALADAAEHAREVLGSEADSIGARLVLTLREQRSSVRWNSSTLGGMSVSPTKERVTGLLLEATHDAVALSGTALEHPLKEPDLVLSVKRLYERAAAERLPASLKRWLSHRLPMIEPPPGFAADLYRALATDPSAAVRRCAAGDRDACRLAFALDSVPANRVAAWYDVTDLPALARTAGDQTQRAWMVQRVGRDEQRACVEQGQLDLCRQMLALLPAEAIRVPMPAAARESLVRLALSIGGREAYARMRGATDSTLSGQLATAAGVPSDELVSRWMRQVVAARPASPLPNATFVLASLAGIAVCVGLAVRGKPWN